MTQASVLKVTANGTTTSPVLRGYWITERILGYQIPPPPPVPAVEPDIRGAVTLRQQLEKHRSDASCASCHSKMDPPGFALESFDIMGGWRDRYRAVKEDIKPEGGIGLNGQAFAFYYALPVDCAGELPDGRARRAAEHVGEQHAAIAAIDGGDRFQDRRTPLLHIVLGQNAYGRDLILRAHNMLQRSPKFLGQIAVGDDHNTNHGSIRSA
jgi:hypothetical protein